jgi:hypothetical protein
LFETPTVSMKRKEAGQNWKLHKQNLEMREMLQQKEAINLHYKVL